MNDFDKHISESAFLVNESRARNVELSRDEYAHLWVSDSTRELWEDFSRDVYPFDEIELGVRNRFFLEWLNLEIASNRTGVFVNIGAGFTSYPFLIDEACRCVEIDYGHVIKHKQERIAKWQNEGTLPKRQVEFIPADLSNRSDIRSLESRLDRLLREDRSFILLEGITYYLEMSALRDLLDLCSRLQVSNSTLAFDFWKPDFADHPITSRFREFFTDRFGYRETDYNLFDVDFIRSLQGYEVVEITDVQEQETILAGTSVLSNYEEILPENYAILKKTSI